MTGAVLLALLPIVALIALGMALRHRRFLDDSFWLQAQRLGNFVLLPCLFFHGLATARLGAPPVGDLAPTLIIPTLAIARLVLALRPLIGVDGSAFTLVFNGTMRFNNEGPVAAYHPKCPRQPVAAACSSGEAIQ